MSFTSNIQVSKSEIFWAEMTPCDHLVQIYDEDEPFLNSLRGFVGSGLRAGDAVIVLATASHLDTLDRRLKTDHFDLSAARASNQYITLDVEEALPQFMVDNWPNEELFHQFVSKIIGQARGKHRRVRAFGELVAVLWGQGLNGATVRLEHLWHQLCQTESFSLFCAYPKSGFTQNADASIREICAVHSKMVPA